MYQTINEAKEFLLNKKSKKAKRLYALYSNMTKTIPLSWIDVNPKELKKVYTKSIDEFIALVDFLSSNDILLYRQEINSFLSKVSETEAEAFIYILTKGKVNYSNFIDFTKLKNLDDLFLVQEIPKKARRVIIKFINGNFILLNGFLPKYVTNKLKLFKNYSVTLDCFYVNRILYVHDIINKDTTKERLLHIKKFYSKNFLIPLEPYSMTYKQLSENSNRLLIKRYNSLSNEIYIKK